MKLLMRFRLRPSGAKVEETRCLRCRAQVTEKMSQRCWQCGETFSFADWNRAYNQALAAQVGRS